MASGRDEPPAVFTCHRGIAPMLWALFAIACAELVIVHLLLGWWWPRIAVAVSLLNLALVAYPNVVLDLAAPVTFRGRAIRTLAHRLDDPDGFARSIERVGAEHG